MTRLNTALPISHRSTPNDPPRSVAWSLLMVMSVACAATLLPGCSQFDIDLSDFSFNKEDEPGTPTRMIPVWTDTVLTRAGQPGVRGFGGRVVFYEDDQQLPIHVEGSLVVYAWDDTDAASLDKVPDRKYVIKADRLLSHYSDSRIGPSYSIWIPWDEAGGEHRKVTLITRFIGSNGAEVVSQPMDAVLPGPVGDHLVVEQFTSPARGPVSLAAAPELVDPDMPAGSGAGVIQPVSWQSGDPFPAETTGQPRMKTTTFDVSPAFAARHFGDNSAPLHLDVARFGHHPPSAYDQLSAYHQQRAIDVAERAADDARTTAQRVRENRSATPNDSLPTRSAPTPLPAQTAQPTRPTASPLRSQPRRATWQPRRSARR